MNIFYGSNPILANKILEEIKLKEQGKFINSQDIALLDKQNKITSAETNIVKDRTESIINNSTELQQ